MYKILFPILCMFCINTQEDNITMLDDVYSIINTLINSDKRNYLYESYYFKENMYVINQIIDKRSLISQIKKLPIDTIFSDKDFIYMRKQYKQYKHMEWEASKLIRDVTIVKRKEIPKKRNVPIYRFSLPIFNETHEKALLYRITYEDKLVVVGECYIFHKEKNEWKQKLCYFIDY